MDLPWGSSTSNKFATTIGLITSKGPYRDNIMVCEWTHHLSYSPGLTAVSLGSTKATVINIQTSKDFGVNLCSTSQSVLSGVSGGYSGRKYDKISALKELGFQFYRAKTIDTLMVKEASLNVECKLFNEIAFGDHIMLIGEVLDTTSNPEKQSLIYYNGRYWSLQYVVKSTQEERERIQNILEKHSKNNPQNPGE